MNWKSFFTPGDNMSTDDVHHFIKDNNTESFTLLDVRQPKEYERGHLGGALLIPVKELQNRTSELSTEQTIIVYCASGVRSKAACQLLLADGFEQIYNMSGGIKAWNGHQASGDELQGMEFFTSQDFQDIYQMAYSMEEGLRLLYLGLADKVEQPDFKKLLLQLADFEDSHKARLKTLFAPDQQITDTPDASLVEGGFKIADIMAHFAPQLGSIEDIFHLGMMLETQALDLYSRLAKNEPAGKNQDFFMQMSKDEANHLSFLADHLDKYSAKQHK